MKTKGRKMVGGIVAFALVPLMALTTAVVAPSSAQATTSSGGGSGSGGTGGSGHFAGWKAWFGTGAYKSFKNWANADNGDVKRVAKGINVGVCDDSVAVWAVYGNMSWKSLNKYNKTNTVATIPTSAPRGNDFKEAGKGAKMPSKLVNEIYNKYDTKDDVWLVCAFHDPYQESSSSTQIDSIVTIPAEPAESKKEVSTSTASYSRTEAYATSTEIDPQMDHSGNFDAANKILCTLKVDGDATSGAGRKLCVQHSDEALTNYAAVVAQVNLAIRNNLPISKAALQQMVDDAVAADKNASTAPGAALLSLDQHNIDGLAEGGVVNVQAMKRYVTVKANDDFTRTKVIATKDTFSQTKTTTEYCDTAIRRDWDWRKYEWGDWYVTKSFNCHSTVKITQGKDKITAGTVLSDTTVVKSSNKVEVGNPNVTGFWQILSVHCNAEGFVDLTKAVSSATVISTGDDSKKISAVAYSRKYDSVPAHLDFGDATNSNKDAAASGTIGFYNKECPYNCSASKTDGNATELNGSSTNIGQTGKSSATHWGSVDTKNNVNSNKFQFFRDNLFHQVTADVWFPTDTGVVKYDGSAPLTTTITRWLSGTPSISESLAKVSARQSPSDTNATPLFLTPGNPTPATQTNWDVSEFNSSTTAILPGLYRTLDVAAQWASETDYPEAFNFKWEYAPTVSTKIPATDIGFKDDGSLAIGILETATASIQGKCYGQFGTDEGLDTSTMFQNYTGTGTENTLDGNILPIKGGTKVEDNPSNLVVQFVRATTE